MTTTKKTKKNETTGTCNTSSRVFRAMWGCEGRGTFAGWESATTAHGRASRLFACPTCRAAKAIANINDPIRQDFLSQIESLAGVRDYRYQASETVNGRPVLRGREPLPSILERWTDLRPRQSPTRD